MPHVSLPSGWRFAVIPQEVIESEQLGPCEKLVIGAILYHMWTENKAWPSIPRLSKLTSFKRRSVTYALRTLEEKGWLQVEYRVGKPTIYRFSTPEGMTPAPHARVKKNPCTTRRGTLAPDAPEVKESNKLKRLEINTKGERLNRMVDTQELVERFLRPERFRTNNL